MFKLALASFIAALALFGYGAIFWISPYPYSFTKKPAQGDEALGAMLRQHLPETGLYLLPGAGSDDQKAQALYQAGPVATIHFEKGGVQAMSPKVFINGFLLGWVTTALLALLLRMANLSSYTARVFLIVVACAAVGAYSILGNAIWWFQPRPWLILNFLYDLSAFLIAGLVLAAFIKPTPTAPAAS
jgi:hypothetical protein